MRFQRQLGGLKLWEIRSHGTSWIHLLSSSSNCSKLWPLVRLFNARSPRKSTKRQSKVGQQINHERMEAESFFFLILFLNWLRPLNHLGITKWRCVWAYRDLWTWLDPRCRPREDWRWPRKKRKTRIMLFFWKLSMEDGKSRDEMSHKFHSEVLQFGATLVNFGWLFCFGRIKRHLLFGSKLEHEYYNI